MRRVEYRFCSPNHRKIVAELMFFYHRVPFPHSPHLGPWYLVRVNPFVRYVVLSPAIILASNHICIKNCGKERAVSAYGSLTILTGLV